VAARFFWAYSHTYAESLAPLHQKHPRLFKNPLYPFLSPVQSPKTVLYRCFGPVLVVLSLFGTTDRSDNDFFNRLVRFWYK